METIKFGVIGLGRGMSFIQALKDIEGAEVVAVCDTDTAKFKQCIDTLGEGVKTFTDYDEMLDSGIDAVVLANFFHQHAPLAIKALDHGIHVISECTTGSTMKECVEICEAVERSGKKYMIAENYPFSAALMECEELCRGGSLGKILYAEGEYNHPATRETLEQLTPGKYHWRAFLARSYYCTHALGPLMYITKEMPVQVSAFAVHSDILQQYDDFRHNYDAFAMMSCKTDGGSLFRFTGCAAMASKSGYRIVGEYGSCETGRTLGGNVNLHYNSWTTPEGAESDRTYEPHWHTNEELASKAGHGGGDFWTCFNFVQCIQNDTEPFFDVYRGAAMSAVGILGWRSCLENGKTYPIPDFRDPAQRNLWRSDDLTPFPDENGNVTLPCHI